jgi:hypothetical protein
MALLAHSIRFGQPIRDLGIDFLDARETKGAQIISGRKSFDPAKARMLEATREHDMAVHPVSPNHESGETHSHLECDSGFLGQHCHWPVLFGEPKHRVENRADARRLPFEVGRESIAPASVRLIAISELPLAIRAPPHRLARFIPRSDKSWDNARARSDN